MIRIVFDAETVLIDTWWNVNVIKHSSTECVYFVLIDTWWNVNMWNLVAGADYSKF